MTLTVDLSISPSNPLYAGLGVTEVGGRGNLPDAMVAPTLNAIGTAVRKLVEATDPSERDLCVLTGPAPIQLYLVAFHAVVHRFREVQYVDGRGASCTVAQHG